MANAEHVAGFVQRHFVHSATKLVDFFFAALGGSVAVQRPHADPVLQAGLAENKIPALAGP